QFNWRQLSIRPHVPTCHHSLHFHRDRFDSSRVAWLRVLMERTGIWETDRKTVRAQSSLTNADSKASQMSQVVEQISTEILVRLLPTSQQSTIAAKAHGPLCRQGGTDIDRRHFSVHASLVSGRIRQEMPGRSQRPGVRIAR